MLYRVARSIVSLFFRLFFKWRIINPMNVPASGATLLVSNHISNLDPPLVGCGVKHRQVHFMAKQELFVPVMGPLLKGLGAFPVKRGAGDRAALRTVFKLLDEGECIGIFPEGTRSKTGEIEEAHSGAALFALRSQAQVVPVAIIGPFKWFHPITIIYGEPLDLSHHYGPKPNKETIAKVTHEIMGAIERLIDEHRARME